MLSSCCHNIIDDAAYPLLNSLWNRSLEIAWRTLNQCILFVHLFFFFCWEKRRVKRFKQTKIVVNRYFAQNQRRKYDGETSEGVPIHYPFWLFTSTFFRLQRTFRSVSCWLWLSSLLAFLFVLSPGSVDFCLEVDFQLASLPSLSLTDTLSPVTASNK